MNIDFDLIKEKYPNGFNKFLNDTGYKLHNMGNNEYYPFDDNDKDCCYCDLEKFFDDNGIIINVYNFHDGNWWRYKILQEKEFFCQDEKTGIETRDEAKQQAIYKAFEILNNNLLEETCKR